MSDYPVDDPVRYLAGRWRLDRRIEDLATGLRGTFTGTAEFVAHADGLAYTERGTLVLGEHHRGPAYRILRYRTNDGGPLLVEFDDGRYFHDLDLRAGRWHVTHPCRADAYAGEFRVLDADRWSQDWEVHGPAKDQRLHTDFRRAS